MVKLKSHFRKYGTSDHNWTRAKNGDNSPDTSAFRWNEIIERYSAIQSKFRNSDKLMQM